MVNTNKWHPEMSEIDDRHYVCVENSREEYLQMKKGH